MEEYQKQLVTLLVLCHRNPCSPVIKLIEDFVIKYSEEKKPMKQEDRIDCTCKFCHNVIHNMIPLSARWYANRKRIPEDCEYYVPYYECKKCGIDKWFKIETQKLPPPEPTIVKEPKKFSISKHILARKRENYTDGKSIHS